jgi:recombination endonuclease VII
MICGILIRGGAKTSPQIIFLEIKMPYKDELERKRYQHEYYLDNKQSVIDSTLEWRKNNPGKVKTYKRKGYDRNRRFYLYRLTQEEYHKMIADQNNLCAICGEPESGKDNRTGEVRALSIDHDHETGRIRKLLCRRCNTGLGNFRDSVPLLQKVIAYLNEEGTRNGTIPNAEA